MPASVRFQESMSSPPASRGSGRLAAPGPDRPHRAPRPPPMTRFLPPARCRALLAALLLATALPAARALEPGQPAPALSLAGPGGQSLSLAQHLGKVVYLDFWASWCGPCRQSFPWMNAMQAKYGPQGLVVVGVNVDAVQADADQFLARLPAQFPVGYDPQGRTARAFGVKGMPTSVLIGRDGTVIRQHAGFGHGAPEQLEAAIAAALGGRP